MLLIFKHISIWPLVVWPDWIPLSECDHHWMCLNALECALSACECLWVSIECGWTRLNIWVRMNTFEWALNAVEMRLSAPEHLWVSVNVTECTPLLIPIWKWVRMNAFERVWLQLNVFECGLSARDRLLASIERAWTRVNVLERALSAHERLWASCIRDLIGTTSVCILVIVQERFEKFICTICMMEDLRITKIWGI